MRQLKKTLASLLVVVSGVMTMTATASAGPPAQRFVVLLGGDVDRVVAAGPVRGVGVLETEHHSFDPDDGTVVVLNRFVFDKGTLLVTFVGHAELTTIPETCVTRTAVDGTFAVTGGTGAYEGANGGGTFTDRGTLVARRGPEGCAEDGIFRAVIRASGTTALPNASTSG